MDVFLVPVGHGRHELYCEIAADASTVADDARPDETTFIGRMKKRVHDAIAEAEHEWRERQAGRLEMPTGRWGRIKARARAWMAEKVAEQRLLWHLRRQETCALVHPADATSDAALVLMRDGLQRDYERHRRWFAWNSVGFVASGVTFFVPGPNILAYYFFFRLAGHYMSMKGARQGLDLVAWAPRPSEELRQLRDLNAVPPAGRTERAHANSRPLGLEQLAPLFYRVTAV